MTLSNLALYLLIACSLLWSPAYRLLSDVFDERHKLADERARQAEKYRIYRHAWATHHALHLLALLYGVLLFTTVGLAQLLA